MPVEIRELVIKTEIRTETNAHSGTLSDEQMRQLKQQVVAECKRQLIQQNNKSGFNR